jgi:hypothetical protein
MAAHDPNEAGHNRRRESMTDVERRAVVVGAEWLDDKKPGWIDLINLPKLEMFDNCVLDQVFAVEGTGGDRGGFSWALDNFRDELGGDKFIDKGFGAHPELCAEWYRFINARRQGTGADAAPAE